MSRSLIAICATAVLVSTGAFAETATVSTNDAGPIASAKVSMEAAVSAAEKHVDGKAVRAEYEKQKGGGWVYDVEVKAGAKVFDVKVDAEKGTVLASTEDTADSDDDGDKAD
jgi:uncharacterized membrane protein YkoI